MTKSKFPNLSLRNNKINNANRDLKGHGMRDRATIRRLKMYKGKAIRNKDGKIIGGQYMSRKPSQIVARIAPNRRWFGNTHIVGQKNLDRFREEMGAAVRDPFTVLLKSQKLPMGLLQDTKFKDSQPKLLRSETFETTFGQKSTRKRPQSSNYNSLASLMKHVEKTNKSYKEEDDCNIEVLEKPLTTYSVSKKIFEKGQSNRIWTELYKVIDASDVLVQVLDVRDPMGTRCKRIENELKESDRRHKHLVILLNKCDLVPTWVTSAWCKKLGQEYPTIAFHASITNSFGKGALISLLRQFAQLHPEKKQISVGFVGYPNVGKSSIINTLKQQKVCVAAPIPGQTRVWQYITLFKRVFLVDCPGVVYPNEDTEEEVVLKGVIRIQNLEDPEVYIPAILRRVRKEYIYNAYGIENWKSTEDFLEKFCMKTGKLLKKGEPDIYNASCMLLHDWQRGRLPYFVPPVLDDSEIEKLTKKKKLDVTIEQLFNTIPVKNKFVSEDFEAPPGLSVDSSDKQEGTNDASVNLDKKTNADANQMPAEKGKTTQEPEIKDQNKELQKQSKKNTSKKQITPIKGLLTAGTTWGGKKKRNKRKKHQRQRLIKERQAYQLRREREIRLAKKGRAMHNAT